MRLAVAFLLLLISITGVAQSSDKRSYTYINAAQHIPGFTDVNQLKSAVYFGKNHKEYQLAGSIKGNLYIGFQYFRGRKNINYQEVSLGHFINIANKWMFAFSSGYGVGKVKPDEYVYYRGKKRIFYGTYDVTSWTYNINTSYQRYYFQAGTYITPAPNTRVGINVRAAKVNYSNYYYSLVKKSDYTQKIYIDEELSVDGLEGVILDPCIFLVTGTKNVQFTLQIGKSIDSYNSESVKADTLNKVHPLFHKIYFNSGLTLSLN